MVKLQKDGEIEDSSLVDRVKGMFKKRTLRQKGVFLPEDNLPKEKGVRSELKNSQQILKQKKIKKGLKFKNMEKGKRESVLQKKRQFKQQAEYKNSFKTKSGSKGGKKYNQKQR